MPGTTDELPRDANGRFTSESDGAGGPALKAISAQLDGLRGTIDSLTQTLDAAARERPSLAKASKVTRNAARKAAAGGRNGARAASDMATQAARVTSMQAREHPAQTLAIAAGVGVAIALCLRALRR